MEIDLCVAMAGGNLDVYAPLFFESLYRNCDMSKIAVHVVEKGAIVPPDREEKDWNVHLPFEYYVPGVGENVHNYLLRKQEAVSTPFTIYEKHDPSEFFVNTSPCEPFWELGSDYYNTLNWMMENCGSNKWVIFCHLDMIFLQDILARLRVDMQDHAGLVGVYAHCWAVNREAFYKVGIKFNCRDSFWLLPVNHAGYDYVLRSGRDKRCNPLPDGAKRLYGFDMLELMEVMMVASGWHCDLDGEHPYRSMVDHMCSGHGYVPEHVAQGQESRRQYWMNLLGVQKV